MSRVSKTSRVLSKIAEIELQAKLTLECIDCLKSIVAPKDEKTEEEHKVELVKIKVEKEDKDKLPKEKAPKKKRKVENETLTDELLPLIDLTDDKTDPKYTCLCGKELSVSSRKRHEKTAAHTLFLVTGVKEEM
jgi:hypothetical protein